MRRTVLLACAFAGIGGCDTPTIPGRDPTQVFAFDLPTQPPVVFRWPVGRVIRVFVASGSNDAATSVLRDAFDAGASGWNELAVFSEYRIARASEPDEADVVLAFSDAILPVDTQDCRPLPVQAVTTFCVESSGALPAGLRVFPATNAAFASRVRMVVIVLGAAAPDDALVQRLVAHELGHVLGIGRHSEDPRDLMWRTDPSRSTPGPRDAATVLVLYHTVAGLVP